MSKVNDLKQENEIKIRECLYDGQIWTKNDLTYKTSLSLATTTNILQEMLKSHEIEYVSQRVVESLKNISYIRIISIC